MIVTLMRYFQFDWLIHVDVFASFSFSLYFSCLRIYQNSIVLRAIKSRHFFEGLSHLFIMKITNLTIKRYDEFICMHTHFFFFFWANGSWDASVSKHVHSDFFLSLKICLAQIDSTKPNFNKLKRVFSCSLLKFSKAKKEMPSWPKYEAIHTQLMMAFYFEKIKTEEKTKCG